VIVFHKSPSPPDLPGFLARFGAGSARRVARSLRHVLTHKASGDGFAAGPSTLGFARPDLSLPAYAGLVPDDGLSPIYHFFDRTAGGLGFAGRITRGAARDYRSGRLTYDEHDGTDFVCPPGMPAVAAAPGVLVAVRDRFLRGGLTACLDHGGVVTQYTHLAKVTAELGQPLARGEVVGLAGHAGLDMVIGFPWVPPHIHFMAWVLGQPVDPFLRDDEDEHAATWLARNDPRPAARPLPDDPPPMDLRDVHVDPAAIEAARALCADPEVAAELDAAPHDAARAAILEDSLHHERGTWPPEARALCFRPDGVRARVRLTLPLPASEYRGARVADAPWTRPPR
jgi:murein DD-endopeptidase MepM/ murein hydrolase activator NlpD